MLHLLNYVPAALNLLLTKLGPELLEPIMRLDVITPEENMGDIIGDLNRRRGQVEGMEDKSTKNC